MANYDRDKMQSNANAALGILGAIIAGGLAIAGSSIKNTNNAGRLQNQLAQVRSELNSVRSELNHYRANGIRAIRYADKIESLKRTKALLEKQERELQQQLDNLS